MYSVCNFECSVLWLSRMRMRYVRQQRLKGRFRGIRRHRTLNRNANVLTKSEILRNAPPWRSGSTCPENLRVVTEFSSWNIHPAYLRPYISLRVHPFSAFALFHLRPLLPYSHHPGDLAIQILRLISLTRFTELNWSSRVIISSFATYEEYKNLCKNIVINKNICYNGNGDITWESIRNYRNSHIFVSKCTLRKLL